MKLRKSVEDAIRITLRRNQQEQWLKENAEAIATYNHRVEECGMFNEGLRTHFAAPCS